MEQAPETPEATPELKPEEVHVRGTHRKRPFVMEEGPCLFEHALTQEVLDMQPKRWAYMETLFGTVKRMVVKVWVFLNNKPTLVYADIQTGTVFLESGECLSSFQRRIVRWGNYQSLEKKQKAAGRTELQDRWNKGL